MASLFITNDVKKLFIAAFREIFAYDADFTYNKTDASLGKLLISSRYAEPKTENKLPQLVLSTAGYSSVPTAFMNNFKEEILGAYKAGIATSSKKVYSNIVQFTLSIDCLSTVKAECELLADKVFNSVTMDDAQLYLELNLNIRAAQVTEAAPRNQYPQYQFISTVTIQGDFMVQWTMEPTAQHPLLADVKLSLTTTEI